MSILLEERHRSAPGVSDGLDRIPAIAAKHKIDVTLGAWMSPNEEKSKKELAHTISVARNNPNVKKIIVGNETLLREDISIEQLIPISKPPSVS